MGLSPSSQGVNWAMAIMGHDGAKQGNGTDQPPRLHQHPLRHLIESQLEMLVHPVEALVHPVEALMHLSPQFSHIYLGLSLDLKGLELNLDLRSESFCHLL
jgi:hypothetical protein